MRDRACCSAAGAPCDAPGRHALLKLVTGGLRVGVSARIAKLALADYGRQPPAEIEELWRYVADRLEKNFRRTVFAAPNQSPAAYQARTSAAAGGFGRRGVTQ